MGPEAAANREGLWGISEVRRAFAQAQCPLEAGPGGQIIRWRVEEVGFPGPACLGSQIPGEMEGLQRKRTLLCWGLREGRGWS